MAIKNGLNNNAYTGDASQGNPYVGDLRKGIDYDLYEANFPVVDGTKPQAKFSCGYRSLARNLVNYAGDELSHNGIYFNGKVLDAGSGTGISSLEIVSHFPFASVKGVELSPGMLLTAQYKWGQDDGQILLGAIKPEERAELRFANLLQYWDSFRKETRSETGAETIGLKNKIQFISGDIHNLTSLEDFKDDSGEIDLIIANQVMHWTKLPLVFQQFRSVLRPRGKVFWNSASHFYNDENFPAKEYGFRYNDFLAVVMEEIAKNVSVKDYHTIANPSHNSKSIQEITTEEGFETIQIATLLEKIDLQTFIQNHIPVFAKQLITADIDEEMKDYLVKEALAKAVVNPRAFQDIKHKYDIVPVFRSVKKA